MYCTFELCISHINSSSGIIVPSLFSKESEDIFIMLTFPFSEPRTIKFFSHETS